MKCCNKYNKQQQSVQSSNCKQHLEFITIELSKKSSKQISTQMSSSKQFLITLAVVAIVLPSVALATEYKVGDSAGWTIKFDYANWANGKEFRVGDKLVFTYPVGAHNVFKVNGTSFKDCTIPPLNEALTSGNDIITLATPGNKWYICGVGQHCAVGGQKLAITVWPALDAPAPAPSSANGVVASGLLVLIASVISFFTI